MQQKSTITPKYQILKELPIISLNQGFKIYILSVTPVSFRKPKFKSTILFLGNLAFNKDHRLTKKN